MSSSFAPQRASFWSSGAHPGSVPAKRQEGCKSHRFHQITQPPLCQNLPSHLPLIRKRLCCLKSETRVALQGIPLREVSDGAFNQRRSGGCAKRPYEHSVGQVAIECRASSAPKAVPEQHLAQVVAEETTDNVRYRHLIRSKSHIIQGDLGLEYGGTDFGPSPKEMVLSGLAMETSLTMRMYADRKNWPLRRIRVVVKEHGRGKGQLPDGLDVVVHFDGELSREQKAALLEVAGKSPVKNMLLGKMTKGISTRIAIKQKARPGPVPELTGTS